MLTDSFPGLPRLRLPSRNWMIFIGVVTAWTVAVQYDRREKRILSTKWARLVQHLADETLPDNALQRRLTIVLGAPPADGVMSGRDHFHEYVKPVLVSSGLDWDVVEGRREGDVRAGVAERIRKMRMMKGEGGLAALEKMIQEEGDVDLLVEEIRDKAGVRRWDGVQGDVVIGRNIWKEYVRGLHEGWLGPLEVEKKELDTTVSIPSEDAAPAAMDSLATQSIDGAKQVKTDDPLMLSNPSDDASPTAGTSGDSSPPQTTPVTDSKSADTEASEEKSEEEKGKPKKRKQPEPFIPTSAYPSATLAPACPQVLGPDSVIPFPHLLGFFNFPTRIYRYLHKRNLADDIGRQVAAAALGQSRNFNSGTEDDPSIHGNAWTGDSSFTSDSDSGSASNSTNAASEQNMLLANEEPEWHKTVRNRDGDLPGKERTWLDEMVLDPRVASRMRTFELSPEDEVRAKEIENEVRREKREQLWDIPKRIGRGVAVTFGYGPKEQRGLDTVGNVAYEDVD